LIYSNLRRLTFSFFSLIFARIWRRGDSFSPSRTVIQSRFSAQSNWLVTSPIDMPRQQKRTDSSRKPNRQ
jgi:hypothetical protein